MKLEQQVCSLELSKRLRELGVKQESLFVWSNAEWELTGELKQGSKWSVREKAIPEPDFSYSAFTVAELGEMLYNAGAKNFMKAYGDVFNFPGTAFVGDLGVMNLMRKPDMAAKMLIYLIEHNFVTV